MKVCCPLRNAQMHLTKVCNFQMVGPQVKRVCLGFLQVRKVCIEILEILRATAGVIL